MTSNSVGGVPIVWSSGRELSRERCRTSQADQTTLSKVIPKAHDVSESDSRAWSEESIGGASLPYLHPTAGATNVGRDSSTIKSRTRVER